MCLAFTIIASLSHLRCIIINYIYWIFNSQIYLCPTTYQHCWESFSFILSCIRCRLRPDFRSFVMHSRDSDRWHFRQQTFISLTDETVNEHCDCSFLLWKPLTKAFKGTWTQHGEPLSFKELRHQEYFTNTPDTA